MVKDSSISSRLFDAVVHLTLLVVLLMSILPILHIASVSVSEDMAYYQGKVTFFPVGFHLTVYELIMRAGSVPRGMWNSVVYTTVGTSINLALTIGMAYALSKKRLTFRNLYTILIMITMFFSGGLIPTFLLIKALGQYDTIWALVLPGAVSPFYLIIMRTFFMAMPVEIEESAFMDGANDIRIMIKLVLPLSKAAIATIGLFYLVAHWNSWFNALIYLKDAARFPLQKVLRDIVLKTMMKEELSMLDQMNAEPNSVLINIEAIKYATLFVSMLPMMLVYPFIQRYFVKGVMIGSLKG